MSTSSISTALRPAEKHEFYYIEKPYGDITLLEILEHTQVYSNRRMIDRHMLLIVDKKDGITKVLSVGNVVYKQMMEIILQPPPPLVWWKRFLIWCGLMNRPKTPDTFDLRIYKDSKPMGDLEIPVYRVEKI